MDRHTEDLLRVASAISVAALEWNDSTVDNRTSITALEIIGQRLARIVRDMKAEG